MTQNTRLYMTVNNESMKQIDKIIKEINGQKEYWHCETTRQAVMRALIEFALTLDIEFSSGYSKYVTVRFKKK